MDLLPTGLNTCCGCTSQIKIYCSKWYCGELKCAICRLRTISGLQFLGWTQWVWQVFCDSYSPRAWNCSPSHLSLAPLKQTRSVCLCLHFSKSHTHCSSWILLTLSTDSIKYFTLLWLSSVAVVVACNRWWCCRQLLTSVADADCCYWWSESYLFIAGRENRWTAVVKKTLNNPFFWSSERFEFIALSHCSICCLYLNTSLWSS